MGKQITYTYTAQKADDLVSSIRRQTWKVWDYGDAIVYGYPGGKMTAYHFLERGANSEVIQEAPIGWCPPSGPAVVYEMEVGLTNNPDYVMIGEYLRQTHTSDNTPVVTHKLINTNQNITNQSKKKSEHRQSIPLSLPVRGPKKDMHSHKKNHLSMPLMSIPLCV